MTTCVDLETFESRELFSTAEASIRRGNVSRAAALLNEALKISPEHPVYLSMLGYCVGIQGNFEAAEKMCRKAIQIAPMIALLHVNLGKVLLEQGRRKEAREALTHAYRIDNTNAPAALELSRMGVRRSPVIPFLNRDHPINCFLGKWRHRILRSRAPELKKL